MSKDTGGPAFPREDYQTNGFDGVSSGLGQEGMTLRDYFAAKAMQGMFAAGYEYSADAPASKRAAHAYMAADAMLAERAK